MAISEQNEDVPILNRIVLIYNKFSNKSSRALASNIELKNIGGAQDMNMRLFHRFWIAYHQ